jgi:hypothetical protein
MEGVSIRPNAKPWTVKEQIVEDPASGLTFQFEVVPGSTAEFRLLIYGETLPFGNREIVFDCDGVLAGGGTATRGLCKPAWPMSADELGS